RREHRQRGILEVDLEPLVPYFPRKPPVDLAHEGRVAQLEVLPGDLLGARHHAEGELLRLHAPVALHVLEPGQRHVGGMLGLLHFLSSSRVIDSQSLVYFSFLLEALEQRDGVKKEAEIDKALAVYDTARREE